MSEEQEESNWFNLLCINANKIMLEFRPPVRLQS